MSADRMTAAGRAFLARWEGCRLRPYQDASGLWTVGVGHLLTPVERATGAVDVAGQPVNWRAGLTAAQAEALLTQDLSWAEAAVAAAGVARTPNEFDALTAYAFNIGAGAFQRYSSVVPRLRAGEREGAMTSWRAWCRVTDPRSGRKVVCEGLRRRREAEIALFLRGDYSGGP